MPHPKSGYWLKNGSRVPGVTTIIGRFKDSSALLWWAFEQGKCAERGEISSLYDKRDEAADAGTLAHSMVQRHINGLPPLSPEDSDKPLNEQAWQGYQNYLTWERDNKIVVVEQEIQLVSERYKFGGCPDAIAINSQDQYCLLDWKTSNGVYQDYIIQLAAYKELWDENRPDEPLMGGFHLLRFSKDHADFSHHYWNELHDAWEQFKLFREAYDIDKKLKKRIG